MGSSCCPVCKSNHLKVLLTLENIPVFVNALAPTSEQAKAVVRGTQQLAQCESCGFVFNRCFEPEKVIYDEGYHAERGNSSAYVQHMSRMLDLIDSVEPLQGKGIFEVACGTGEFLQLAAQHNPRYCVGVDPSADESESRDLTIHQALFNQEYIRKHPPKIDILINRHMIEHMQEPLEMLRLFAYALPEGGVLYIETPRLDWILKNRVFYDFPYEHCSYYSDDFMTRLLKAAGFSIATMEFSYDGQYFSICARKQNPPGNIEAADRERIVAVQKGFGSVREILTGIGKNPPPLGSPLRSGTGMFLWGAAAKGVMCANLIKGLHISGYIDQNPHKQGMFIPGTGHMVLSPEVVSYPAVKTIFVENDVYLSEIQEKVREIDTRIQVLSLNSFLGLGTLQRLN